MQVPIFTPHTSIQVTSHVNPGHDNWILDVVPLQRIQVSRWLSLPNPCPISPSAKSQDLHLTPSQAPRFISPLHPGPENCIWAAFRSPQTLKPKSQNVDVKCFQVLSHLHPGPKILVSPTSRYQDSTKAPIYIYCLISILTHVFASHLHLWHDVHASRLLVAYHYHPCHENCISPPP